MTIWKSPFKITDAQEILMPAAARILSVQTQNDEPYIWALVDPHNPTGIRRIRVFGTGHDVPLEIIEEYRHEGTILTHGDSLVWHVFVSLSTFM